MGVYKKAMFLQLAAVLCLLVSAIYLAVAGIVFLPDVLVGSATENAEGVGGVFGTIFGSSLAAVVVIAVFCLIAAIGVIISLGCLASWFKRRGMLKKDMLPRFNGRFGRSWWISVILMAVYAVMNILMGASFLAQMLPVPILSAACLVLMALGIVFKNKAAKSLKKAAQTESSADAPPPSDDVFGV